MAALLAAALALALAGCASAPPRCGDGNVHYCSMRRSIPGQTDLIRHYHCLSSRQHHLREALSHTSLASIHPDRLEQWKHRIGWKECPSPKE